LGVSNEPGAAQTAVGLAVNGSLVGTDTVPAMLLFLLWSVVASIYLSITASRRSQVAPTARVPAHA
jgi:hypothetical protein